MTNGCARPDVPPELCTGSVVHAYTDPLLAVFMDAAHGGYGPSALLWEAEGEVVISAHDKVGCRSLTTVRQIGKPAVTTEQRIRFGILAAWEVCKDRKWRKWAKGWLDGSDRSDAAADAARAAADAARAAAYAARAAYAVHDAAYAAHDAAYAAHDAAYAAYAAADAARAARAAAASLDLVAIAHKAVE